jgi:tetratricopeptide (TPR) repeat protein
MRCLYSSTELGPQDRAFAEYAVCLGPRTGLPIPPGAAHAKQRSRRGKSLVPQPLSERAVPVERVDDDRLALRREKRRAYERCGRFVVSRGHRTNLIEQAPGPPETVIDSGVAVDRMSTSWQGTRALGFVAIEQGEYDKAKSLFEESLVRSKAFGQRAVICWNLYDLGRVARFQGEPANAQALFTESLLRAQDLGLKGEIAFNLWQLAEIADERGEYGRAAQLFGAFEALHNNIGAQLTTTHRTELEQSKGAVRARLGEEGWTKAWEAGQGMSMEAAIRYALE